MSKELEALERIRNGFLSERTTCSTICISKKLFDELLGIIETALHEKNNLERKLDEYALALKDRNKKLKALEIIKEKEVNVYWLTHYPTLDEYNEQVCVFRMLNKEEYDLLKEELM